MVDEIENHLFQLGRFHLSVPHHHTRIGHILMNEVLNVRELRNAMSDDINLAVATEFEIDRIGNDLMAEGMNFRANGVTIGRRRVDDTEIARAHERKLQGARNGRRRHRERVDIDFELPQTFLDRDTEFLFLIDDEQPEVFEFHRFPDELVRPDEDVDLSVGQILEQRLGLRRRAGTRKVIDAHREILQSLGKCFVVLQRQNGGGHHHRHLFAVGGCLESGANRNFGFAETHIATHQAVHRTRLLHVGLHLSRHPQLVGRVFVGERGFEFLLQETVGRKSKTFFCASATVEQNQIARNVFELLLRALLEAFPRAGAKMRKPGRRTLLPLVLRNLVERVDRHENRIVVLIFDLDHFLHGPVAARDAHESDKLPHSMIDMHHIVARLKLTNLFERERHLGIARVVGTQIVLVETIEDLVVGVEGGSHLRVGEPFVEGEVDGREKRSPRCAPLRL